MVGDDPGQHHDLLVNLIFGDNGEATWSVTIPVSITTFSSANSASDEITTGLGNDTILAGAGADTIVASDGNNTIFADEGILEYDAAGNLRHLLSLDPAIGGTDNVSTGTGRDIIVGGKAEDVITAGDGDNLIFGDNGEATWSATIPVNFVTFAFNQSHDDKITTGLGNDTILAGAGADVIVAGDGNNIVFADEGELDYDAAGILEHAISLATDIGANDEVTTGSGIDIIFGGTADDLIVAGDGDNLIFGDNGEAEWLAGIRSHYLTFAFEDAGDDDITTGSGHDVILAGAGSDVVNGGEGNNYIFGDEAEISYDTAGVIVQADSIEPAEGDDDTITTGAGDDTIIGGVNLDTISAGDGNNVVLGDNGELSYVGGLASLFLTITPENSYNDAITTGSGRDIILGGNGTDTINGGDGDNLVLGDEGRITLTAGIVNLIASEQFTDGQLDTITTGAGNDIIVGGHGADTIAAGDGDNVVAGDNAVLTLPGGVLAQLEAIAPSVGAIDFITTGEGNDVIMAGIGGDDINAGEGNNVVIGDHATVTFSSNQFATLTPTTPEIGGADTIRTGAGADRIVGGTDADWISAGDGHNVVAGDHVVILQTDGILTRVEAVAPANGGVDLIFTGSGNDLVLGGTAGDTIHSGAGNDLVFGDHALIAGTVDLALLPLAMAVKPFTFTATVTQNLGDDDRSVAGDDVVFAGTGDDIVFGQQGADMLFGGDGDDDLIGGHNVSLGQDGDDVIDAGVGFDVVAGDNASILRTGDNISPRARVLAGTAMFDDRGNFLALDTPQAWPTDVAERAVVILDHAFDTIAGLYGTDHLIGGADNDMLFGQLGDDFIHGDSTLPADVAADGTIDRSVVRAAAAALFTSNLWAGTDSDGDDYIEGNGGNDFIFGGLGQDDIVGGNSSMYGLLDYNQRPDGSDTIYGGNGTAADFEDMGDSTLDGRARDADVILGDNGNIVRLVGLNGVSSGAFLTFAYDAAATQRIIVRGFDLLDYTVPESPDDIGGADTIYGEAGDDTLHGQVGTDLLLGNGNDDNLYGGQDDDNIFGGGGDDTISHSDELKPPPPPGKSAADVGNPNDGETSLVGDDPVLAKFVAPPSNLPVALRGDVNGSETTAVFFAQIFLGLGQGGSSWLASGGDPVFADGGSEWRIFTSGVFASFEYGAPSNLVGPAPTAVELDELLQDESVVPPSDEGVPAAPETEIPANQGQNPPADSETPSDAPPANPSGENNASEPPAEDSAPEQPADRNRAKCLKWVRSGLEMGQPHQHFPAP